MKEYIFYNRTKIFFQLKWTSITLTLIWVIFLLVEYNKGEAINFLTIMVGFIIATILFPLFVGLLLALEGCIAFNRYNKIINGEPFNQLKKLGFKKSYTDKKSNWATSMPTLIGHMDGYPVRVEIEKGIVNVIADIDLDQFQKEHMTELKQIFGEKKVDYDWLGIALFYSPFDLKSLKIQSLESDLKQFIRFFQTKKLGHWDINSNC